MRKTRTRRYATLEEAADYLRCTKITIRRMTEDGRLTAYREAGRANSRIVRVDLNEIDDLLDRGSYRATSTAGARK